MKIENARRIVKAANELDLDVTLREDYSGRGMMGRSTAGVVGSMGDIVQSIALAANELGPELGPHFIEDMAIATDSMGRSSIIAY